MEKITKQCAEIVIKAGYGSVSLIQRELTMGYKMAANQMDILEKLGVVGPFSGTQNRKVLVNSIDEISQSKAKEKATLSDGSILYENDPLTDDEVSEAIALRKMRDSGQKMFKKDQHRLHVLFKKSFKHINELNLSGYAGVNSLGTIVDRRKYPDAVPIQENGMFGVAKPKKLK